MFACCECCVLSGRGLCDELIARLEESYQVWCVVVCDLETSIMRGHDPRWVAALQPKKKVRLKFCRFPDVVHVDFFNSLMI
jgi:hypothetical protein